MLKSANIFLCRRFSSSLAFVWAIIDASMPPYFARHFQNDALLMRCSRRNSATGTPPSACRRIAMIRGSVYLLVFLLIFSWVLPGKFDLSSPYFRGDCHAACHRQSVIKTSLGKSYISNIPEIWKIS